MSMSAPHVLIVEARFYDDLADELARGAIEEIEQRGGTYDRMAVPGVLEVPAAVAYAVAAGHNGGTAYDGYVALGCVIRGETTHYETGCNDSSRGIALLGLQGLCIGNGILTVETRAQAEVRADPGRMNKGAGAAAAALHLIALARKWGGPRKGVGFQPATDEYRLAGDTKGKPSA